MKPKLIFLQLFLISSLTAFAQSEKVVVCEGFAFTYIDENDYFYEVTQWEYDVDPIPKSEAQLVVFSAEKGQGWCHLKEKVNIRKGPGTEFEIIERFAPTEADWEDQNFDAFPCLGKTNGWYKIQPKRGGIGYVREDLVERWEGGGPIVIPMVRVGVQIGGIVYNLNVEGEAIIPQVPGHKYNGDVRIPSSVFYDGKEYIVTTIESFAFNECKALTITIPKSVTRIENDAFHDCKDLMDIYVMRTNPVEYNCIKEDYESSYSTFENVPTSKCTLHVPPGCKAIYKNTPPWSYFKRIEEDFFIPLVAEKVLIDSIYYDLNENDEAIVTDKEDFKYAGEINIPTSVTYNGKTFSVTGIGSSAFAYNVRLKSVNIPNSIKTIGSFAFQRCSGLTKITIPNSVTSIGRSAFEGCFMLKELTLGNSVSNIGPRAFSIDTKNYAELPGLTDIYVLRTDPTAYNCEKEVYEDEYTTFDGISTSKCTLHVPAGCIHKYKSTPPWSYFQNVFEVDMANNRNSVAKINDYIERHPYIEAKHPDDWIQYLQSHLKYPTIAIEQEKQGIVRIEFVVGKDGSISQMKVLKSLSKECDAEAMRVIRSARWIPAKDEHGNAITSIKVQEVQYVLQ